MPPGVRDGGRAGRREVGSGRRWLRDLVAGLDGRVELRVAATAAEVFDEQRDEGDGEDDDHGVVEVAPDERDAAEDGAEGGDADSPQGCAEQVVGEERAVAHASDAGDDGREGAYDGD